MLRLLVLYCLIHLNYIVIKCMIPIKASELTVRTLDEKLIERKRQDTMDMCRIFNEESEKLEKYNHIKNRHMTKNMNVPGHRRSKRGLAMNVMNPTLSLNDAQRVETIVDKLYDDLLEQGEKVSYRRVDIKPLQKNGSIANKLSGRRFDFAPHVMDGPKTSLEPKGTPSPLDGPPPPAKTPRFKLSIVPYFINRNTYDSHLADIIVKAFDYFEKATCIRFQRLHERPTDKESLHNVEWLYITNPTGIRQCVHSNERTLVKGVQMVVLGYDCMSLGDIIHEIMHVLGFSHEHTRTDRDKFISILWNNIKPGYKKFFDRLEEPNVIENMPYDYSSVLHYPSRAFSKNGQVTILTEPGIKIGQREGLSEMDIEKISMVYSAECVKRNRQYLIQTCPSVVKTNPELLKATKEDIDNYYKNRLWPYGIVNYMLKNDMEFSHDEKENILAVIRHIETETCIEFRDLTSEFKDNDVDVTNKVFHKLKKEENNKNSINDKEIHEVSDDKTTNTTNNSEVGKETLEEIDQTLSDNSSSTAFNKDDSDNEIKTDDKFETSNKMSDNDSARAINNEEVSIRRAKKFIRNQKPKSRQEYLQTQNTNKRLVNKKARPISPSRRHATDVLVFTRSPKPGCPCPKSPGVPGDPKIIEINTDCFNSVNILLHLFVHILGLDHQHNSHDRDSYLHIIWDQLTNDLKEDMKQKLPPAASAGFAYDYQSVMHYPWLQIKDGRTNIMYPIWNDGWAMGNWQGLSSVDVQKLNLLYSKQCSLRRKEAEAAGVKLRSHDK